MTKPRRSSSSRWRSTWGCMATTIPALRRSATTWRACTQPRASTVWLKAAVSTGREGSRRQSPTPNQSDTAKSLDGLGRLYFLEGKYTLADPPLRASPLAIREKAPLADGAYLGQSLKHLAELARAQGQNEHAAVLYKRLAEALQKAAAADPNNPNADANLAWFEATCPDPQFRDATGAFANASKA